MSSRLTLPWGGVVYLTQSVSKVVPQQSTPPQIYQLILYYFYIQNELTDLCGN